MEITRDELLESAATEVHSTTPTKLDPIERPSKKKKKASQHERILAHKDIFHHHMMGKQRGENYKCMYLFVNAHLFTKQLNFQVQV